MTQVAESGSSRSSLLFTAASIATTYDRRLGCQSLITSWTWSPRCFDTVVLGSASAATQVAPSPCFFKVSLTAMVTSSRLVRSRVAACSRDSPSGSR